MVSALAVRKSEFESINSEKMTTVLSSAPMLWEPSRIAYADTPEKLFTNASKPRVKSKVS
jgi:hypothetical protein